MVPNVWAIMQAGNLFVFCVNNPVMWIDPSGRTIILSGSEEDRVIILDNLNELTDHTLDFNRTTGRLEIVAWADSDNINFAYGNRLIERLINNRDTITIKINHTHISGNFWDPAGGRGILNHTILFDPNFMTDERPAFIGLAHELIHGHFVARERHVFGSTYEATFIPNPMSPLRSTHMVREVRNIEYAVIGIGEFNIRGDITENMIRAEHGIAERRRYFTR